MGRRVKEKYAIIASKDAIKVNIFLQKEQKGENEDGKTNYERYNTDLSNIENIGVMDNGISDC